MRAAGGGLVRWRWCLGGGGVVVIAIIIIIIIIVVVVIILRLVLVLVRGPTHFPVPAVVLHLVDPRATATTNATTTAIHDGLVVQEAG